MPDSGHLLPCGGSGRPPCQPRHWSPRRCRICRCSAPGKVRDVYDLGDSLLIVATDRISAFDYILATGIPDKGRVLTQLSAFWFQRLAHVIANHFVTMDVEAYPPAARAHADDLRGRSMLVRKTAPIESSVWRAGICRDRAGRSIARPARLRHRAAAGTSRIRPPARAHLHAGDEGGIRPRHQHRRGRGHASG